MALATFADKVTAQLEQENKFKVSTCVDRCIAGCRAMVRVDCSQPYASVLAQAIWAAMGRHASVDFSKTIPTVHLPRDVVVFSHLHLFTAASMGLAFTRPYGVHTFPTGARADLVLGYGDGLSDVFLSQADPQTDAILLADAMHRHAAAGDPAAPATYALVTPPELMNATETRQRSALEAMQSFATQTGAAVIDVTTSTLRAAGEGPVCAERQRARRWPPDHFADGFRYGDPGPLQIARQVIHALRIVFDAGGRAIRMPPSATGRRAQDGPRPVPSTLRA